MPSFNAHWKGFPHNHLPRIQSTSIRRASITSQCTARSAAEQVLRTPLSAALQQERRKQRYIVRSRRNKSSRSSGATSPRRKSYSRTSRNIQLVRKQNLRLRSGVTTPYRSAATVVSSARTGILAKQTATNSSYSIGTVLDFEDTDGARSSRTSKAKHQRAKAFYSSMYVPDKLTPKILGKNTAAGRRSASPVTMNRYPGRQSVKYAHTRPLNESGLQETYKSSRVVGWARSYDPRIDPQSQVDCVQSGQFSSRESARSFHARASSPMPISKLANASFDDTLWETIDSTRFTSYDTVSSTPTAVSSEILSSNVPCRTRSQIKRLTRFEKELELHYKAVSSLPKKSLITSPSTTTISANTIKDLVPFHAQFHAAGLAVTSSEQQQTNSPSKHNAYSPCVPNIADRRPKQIARLDGPSSFASGTTGTTILGFTPPHEKTYGMSTKDRARGSSTASDFTAVGFTPPHEQMVARSPLQPSRPAPMSPTKGHIPWLQRQDLSPKARLSPPRLSNAYSARPHRHENAKSLETSEIYQAPQNTSGRTECHCPCSAKC
jgi:hypothetical protein